MNSTNEFIHTKKLTSLNRVWEAMKAVEKNPAKYRLQYRNGCDVDIHKVNLLRAGNYLNKQEGNWYFIFTTKTYYDNPTSADLIASNYELKCLTNDNQVITITNIQGNYAYTKDIAKYSLTDLFRVTDRWIPINQKHFYYRNLFGEWESTEYLNSMFRHKEEAMEFRKKLIASGNCFKEVPDEK